MYAQFRFLDHPRFSDLPSFRRVFGISMSGGAARAAKAMQVELSRLMMRRTKEEMLCGRKLLDLTPKIISTTQVEFGPEERYLYRIYEAKTINEVNRLRRVCQLFLYIRHSEAWPNMSAIRRPTCFKDPNSLTISRLVKVLITSSCTPLLFSCACVKFVTRHF